MKRGGIVVLAPVAVVALVVVALVVQPRHHALANGEADVVVDGAAVITRVNGSRQQTDGRTRLHSGDTIEVQRGVAHIITNDATYQARASLDPSASANRMVDTRLRMAEVPELLAGELLVEEANGAIVDSGGTNVAVGSEGVSSSARLSHSLALGVSVYRGSAVIDSAGSRLTVTRLRSAEVASLGTVPADLQPVSAVATDPWDREFLQPAIDINTDLGPLINGFDNNVGKIVPASLHAESLPATSDAALQDLLTRAQQLDPALNPSGAIVGAAIASLGRAQSFDSRWNSVFQFHALSASWGIVAMDQNVDREPLLSRVRSVVDAQSGLPFDTTATASPPGQTVVPAPVPVTGSTSPPLAPPSTTAGTTATTVPRSILPVTPPSLGPPVTLPILPSLTSPDPSSGKTPLQGVIDGATTLLSGLLNSISGPSGLLH